MSRAGGMTVLPKNRDVFLKTAPLETLSSMNTLLIESSGNASVCVMNALMSADDAEKRCEKYPNNNDGKKCEKCIAAWLDE